MTSNIALSYRQGGGTYIFKPEHSGRSKSARPDATGLEEGTIYLARDECQACVVVDGQWSDWFDLRGADWNTNVANKPILGTAATLDAGTAAGQLVQLDADGALPPVDGSKLTNLPAGGGTSNVYGETTLSTSGTQGYDYIVLDQANAEWDGVAEPLAPRTNYALAVANYGEHGSDRLGSATLMGLPGATYSRGSDHRDYAVVSSPIASADIDAGDTVHVAVLFRPGGADTETHVNFGPLPGDIGNFLLMDISDGTVREAWAPDYDFDSSFPAPASRVIDLGNEYYIGVIEITFNTAPGTDITIGIGGGPQHSTEVHEFVCLFVGLNEKYTPDGSGDDAKVNVPGYSVAGTQTLDMTMDRNQVATLDDGGSYTLALPPSPSAGQTREHYTLVTLSGGSSLSLPTGAGITNKADAGPFTSDVDLFVLARGDGTYRIWADGS